MIRIHITQQLYIITYIAEITSKLFFEFVFCKILWQFLHKIELGLQRNPSLLETVSILENTDGKLRQFLPKETCPYRKMFLLLRILTKNQGITTSNVETRKKYITGNIFTLKFTGLCSFVTK